MKVTSSLDLFESVSSLSSILWYTSSLTPWWRRSFEMRKHLLLYVSTITHFSESTSSKYLFPRTCDRFFQERFKELAFKIVINVFKRTKIIESFKDFVKNCSVSRNCFIIFRYKNSTINDCGFVFWISGKKLFDFYTDNRSIELEHIVFIITGIFSK